MNWHICHKKNYIFCSNFWHISCVFTKILIGRACWMWNLISHPTSTHTAYFWRTPLPQKQEIPEKNVMMASSSRFFRYLLFLGYRGPSKVYSVGTRWMRNQIPHPTSSLDRNLSKKTGRYVENTNTKVVFFFLPPKLINIILLF